MRLLLVEDGDHYVRAIEDQLEYEEEDYEVARARTLSEAMHAVRTADFDCTLIGQDFSDGSAVDFLQATGVAGRMPVLILLTDDEPDERTYQAMQYGAADFVDKSELETRGLSRAIRAAVERYRLVELRTRLHHAERFNAIGQLAAGVAHGINNPAGALMTYLELIRENLSQVRGHIHAALADPAAGGALQGLVAAQGTLGLIDEMHDFAEHSSAAGHRINEMVTYLAAFSRGQREEAELLNITDIVRMAGRLARTTLPSGVHLVEELADTPDIVGHRARLCGMIVALISNAGQAFHPRAEDDRTITLRTHADADGIIVEVEDSGQGIEAERLARIFEPFFTTRREHGQVGLGLSVCSDVASAHGGAIEVESEVGEGTRVFVRLPRDTGLGRNARPAQTAAITPDSTLTTGNDDARVLVIDDDPLVRPALGRLLGKRHSVTEADGGAHALALLEKHASYDVIICDVVMPDMDGPELYRRVCQRWPELAPRFVFMTGAAFGHRAMEFVDRVDVPVLHKPVPRERLFAVVDAALGRS